MQNSVRLMPTIRLLTCSSRQLRAAQQSRLAQRYLTTTSSTQPQRNYHASSIHHSDQSASKKPFEQEKPPSVAPPTDFASLDIFGNVPQPPSLIDTCIPNGFMLSNDTTIEGSGLLYAGGQAFKWNPLLGSTRKKLLNEAGQWEIDKEAFGIFELMWPKPGMFWLFL
jgi:NADH dehydrogenase [ubiquinone] 1 alpha subcomplex assembly factor 3